jgi:hypothetical protein
MVSKLSLISDLRLRSSVQDNSFKLDGGYLERAIITLFKIDLINYIKNKAALAKNFHIQPSELDKMPTWEYEYFMMALNDMVNEENDEQKKEMAKYNIEDYKKMANPKNYQNAAQPKMPSVSMPNIQAPKMPKF